VARATGVPGAHIEDGICWVESLEAGDEEIGFMPSTDRTTGGRVICHLNISIFNDYDPADRPTGFWMACIEPSAQSTIWGATPLIAAMSTAVYAEFGDELAVVWDPFNRRRVSGN
jgi:hypothetical protein